MRHRRRRRGRRVRVGQERRPFPLRAYRRGETIPAGRYFVVLVAARLSDPPGPVMAELNAALDRIEGIEGVINFPDVAARNMSEGEGVIWAWEAFATNRELNATRVVGFAEPLGRGIFDGGRSLLPGIAEQSRLAAGLWGLVAEDIPAVMSAAVELVRGIVKKPGKTLKWAIGVGVAVAAVVGIAYVATRGK